jgi:two-component system chemotaxis response regulator CheB
MKHRVLIIDDSALVRRLLRDILSSDPDIEVVGASPDPIAGWNAICDLSPDVLTLDVEMPKMDGIAFLEKLMKKRPMPVVMVSSLTEKSCDTTLRALQLGAVDFVTKPRIDVTRGTVELAAELCQKVKSAARAHPRPHVSAPPLTAAEMGLPTSVASAAAGATALHRVSDAIVALGASTGGTEAISTVLRALPPDAPGMVIVQHMPANFTKQFAERLNRNCAVRVKEAEHGDRIIPGHVLLAPGGERHMEVVRSGANFNVRLIDGPPVNFSRPAVDVLFRSVAKELGRNAVGVLLTGMGADGAAGMLEMRKAGARTIAQDEDTCVVYGMPKEAADRGAVMHVLPLPKIAAALVQQAFEVSHRRS